jgi:hypothetical protein
MNEMINNMIGEKFVENKIEGNKIIKVFEFKNFEHDYEDIAQDINDYITDEPEELYFTYGICGDFDGDWISLDVDRCIDGIEEFLGNCSEEEIEEEYEWLSEHLNILREASGFDICFNADKKDYGITNELKVGDRVKAVIDIDNYDTIGKLGIVKGIDENGLYMVNFDDIIISYFMDRHTSVDCNHNCVNGHGLYCSKTDITKVE